MIVNLCRHVCLNDVLTTMAGIFIMFELQDLCKSQSERSPNEGGN